MGCGKLHILLIACNSFRQPGNGFRVFLQHHIFQSIFLAQVAGFEHIELAYLHVQIALFNDKRIAGGQGLNLGVTEGRFVHIVCHTHRRFGGHNLSDEFLLVFHELIQIGIKSPLRDIPEDLNLWIHVALPHNTAQPLSKVGRTPRTIQIMEGNKPILDIGACAHLLGAAHEDTHLTGAHF